MCFTNVNEARIRYRYFMYSTNKCTDFNKNITLLKKKKKKKLSSIKIWTRKRTLKNARLIIAISDQSHFCIIL